MRSRRGQAAEVPPERVFGRLWGRMTDQGWRVMAKPHWFARGDPRTWIYCAPEVLDAAGKLRRDAGELGESIFLDKDDLWTWAQRSGWALPADDDDDATGDREGSPSSADEPDDAAPTSEHHYYRLCIDHHNRLDASRVEARALAAEAATVPEHVLLSPQSPEAPASAKWKEDDRIEAFCRKDMARYYPGTVHEVNVDGTYAVIFDGEKYRDDSPPYLYDADVLEDHIRELADGPATPAPAAPVMVRSRAGRQRERRGRRVRAQEHEEAHVRAGAGRVVGPRVRVGAIAAIEAAAGGGSGGAGGAATAL